MSDHSSKWEDLLSRNWGFVFVQGDLDGFPDANISLEFEKTLDEHDCLKLSQLFNDWYRRGSEDVGNNESEFGDGFMHYMGELEFSDKTVNAWFDFGLVDIERAMEFLLGELSGLNGSNRLMRVVFGWDDKI